MSFWAILYSLTIRPLQLFFEVIYTITNTWIHNPGLSIVVLSLAMNFLVLPLYKRADAVQEEEKNIENKLRDGVAHIRKTFKGDEKMMILNTYYRQNNYRPTDVFKGSISLFLEIPFFIAAYQFLSHLSVLQGVSFGPIRDLGAADALISIGAISINVLPIIMTAVNLVSCFIFTKGYPLKTKIQLFGMAVFFFFFLYKSPSGLVFYWTLNNVFSLIKTIFYKLKNPKKVLNIMFAVIGLGFVVSSPFIMKAMGRRIVGLIVALLGVVMMMPFVFAIIKRKSKKSISLPKAEGNGWVFLAGAAYMTLLTGVLIPASVIKASPQEFINVYNYVHPLWFVCSAFCLSVGLFIIWFGVFYRLIDKSKRYIFDLAIWVMSVVATVDYLFFAKNLGIMSSSLAYERIMTFTSKQKLINLLVVIVVAASCIALFYFIKKNVGRVMLVGSAAIAIMSVIYFVAINKSVSEVKDQIEAASSARPSFKLSKNGKNVVVIMLDRAMGEFMPYFINEKPELKEMYSGFTYYANTISFGAYTNVGSTPLYGGYEYTPQAMNARPNETLKDKHDEALMVMPVLFADAGYDVSVCDPTFAGYMQVPDLSIYDEYPEIDTCLTEGYYWDNTEASEDSSGNLRNFFLFSIMKESPLIFHEILYNNGKYNEGISFMDVNTDISTADGENNSEGCLTATGNNIGFVRAYTTLDNFIDMTKISDNEVGSFVMISNNTTHEPQLLQEPDYIPVNVIDNTEYETAHRDRYTVDGKTLNMETPDQYIHYQSNMGALLCLGKWLDYLKEEDMYDNTRIVIVADHGRGIEALGDMMYYDDTHPLGSNRNEIVDGKEVDILNLEYYYPLLMFKDFGSEEFSVSDEFMTNADAPVLALTGAIDNPINPATGKLIDSSEKTAHPQYVYGNSFWALGEEGKKTYEGGVWFTVEDDMRKRENWTLIEDNR